MNNENLAKISSWFDEFVKGYYGRDELSDFNIERKDIHSRRVCEEMDYLTEALGLDENQRKLGWVIALLHDVGRFEQFLRYRTYNDVKSVCHSSLGVEIIEERGVLDGVSDAERDIVLTAVRYHGIKELPAALNGHKRLYCELIRDADKLDIFKVVLEYLKEYLANPGKFKLEVDLPEEDGYSMEVANALIAGETIDYKLIKNWNDLRLLQLGWVYDINFGASFERLKERGYLEEIAGYLPEDELVRCARDKVFAYVDEKIESEKD